MQLLVLKHVGVMGIHSQAAIAERLLIDAPAVSRLVDRLEEDGLVERRAGENRRCVRLEITEAGRKEYLALSQASEWLERASRDFLAPEESAELSRLLDKLQNGLCQLLASDPALAGRKDDAACREPGGSPGGSKDNG
jgi:MarR family transcriptional regulator, transcriptional regulator for hemolysin